jgi:hypothetical protein
MASGRETILARLLLIAAATPGINAAVRNAIDGPLLLRGVRPMITIQDAHEVLDVSTIGGGVHSAKHASMRLPQQQRMVMTPEIRILASAAPDAIGTLLNQCADRFLEAVTQDTELLKLVGIDPATKTGGGEIRYEAVYLEPAAATSQERQLLVTLVFTYLFKMAGT